MSKVYTEAQQRAIETTGCHLCVDAGAGSGKTMVLIERMLRLLETRKATLDEIVAITFTERAAGEMKERLRREAHKRAPHDDADAQSFWRDIERRADTARISTIHAFCMAVLKEQALALDQDPDFAILNDAEGHILRYERAEQAIHEALERQDEAVVRLAVEFGAKALTEELVRLLKQRGKLERALAAADYGDAQALVAYWREVGARACMARLDELRPEIGRVQRELEALDGCCTTPGDKREKLRRELVAAAHALATASTVEKAICAYSELCGLSAVGGSKKAWTSEDAFQTIKDHRDLLKELLAFLNDQVCDPALQERAALLTCDLAGLYHNAAADYRRAKRERAVMEFDDLILDTLAIVRDREDIRRNIAHGIKYLLIDEFQDTDNQQLELAQWLAAERPGPELFFVGDAKQSIYYFRGAEVQVFDKARVIAEEPIRLDTNFRTVPDVLEFVNEFFERSELLHLVERSYRRMIPYRAAAAGACIELIHPPDGEEKSPARESRREEARLLAARIRAMVNEDDPLHIDDPDTHVRRPVRYGDIAMLFRATNDLYLYEQALQAAGVPYYVVAGSGFYQRQEILDLLNLLHVVIDPHDRYALFGFLRSPIAAITDETLLHLEWDGGFAEAFAREHVEGPQRDAWRRAQGLIAELRAHRDLPIPVFLRRVLDTTAYEAILLGQFLGRQKVANVRKMVDLAHQFGQSRAPSLRAFVRYMNDVANVELPEGEASMLPADGQAVILMTIHKSKGLEFPIVFVPDLGRELNKGRSALTAVHPELGVSLRPYNDEGTFQTTPFHALIQQEHFRKEEAEHARILYVALTRARDRLVLSSGPGRCARGSWLESLLCVLQPNGKHDEVIVSTEGTWQCHVMHHVPAPATFESTSETRDDIDSRAIRRQILPIDTVAVNRLVLGVSDLLRLMAPHDESHSAYGSARAGDAMRRGEVVHRFFELWDGAEDLDAIMPKLVIDLGLTTRDVARYREDLGAIAARVSGHPLLQAICATPRAMRERPFVLRIGDALVRGEIDALLFGGRVLDYKTGTRRPGLETRYRWQLCLYAAAVEALDGSAADEAVLFYVDSGEAVSIDVSKPRRDEAVACALAAIETLRQGVSLRADMDDQHVRV